MLRAEIKAGRYAPGDQLPSERELRERFTVSGNTVKQAIVQLRAEGWVESRQGSGVFVREGERPLHRLDQDVTKNNGFYSMLDRMGLRPATTTTVTRGPADEEVAEALELPAGAEVVIRHRVMRAEGRPTLNLATSYFPLWVIEAAPKLADPNVSGMPTWIRNAFGATYSEDLINTRLVTDQEAGPLEVEPGTPVITIKGFTRDQAHRALHYIRVVVAPDRMPLGYRYGEIPAEG